MDDVELTDTSTSSKHGLLVAGPHAARRTPEQPSVCLRLCHDIAPSLTHTVWHSERISPSSMPTNLAPSFPAFELWSERGLLPILAEAFC